MCKNARCPSQRLWMANKLVDGKTLAEDLAQSKLR